MMHMCQIAIVIFYVDFIYLENNLCATIVDENGIEGEPVCEDNPYAIILLGGIFYPFCYNLIQSAKNGVFNYVTNLGNWADILYIFGSIGMSISHLIMSPFHIISKLIMIFVIMLSIVRTFKFMRIFASYSPIVTMLQQVMIDLQQFMLFYTILIGLFSLLWGAIGLGNLNGSINPIFAATFDEDAL